MAKETIIQGRGLSRHYKRGSEIVKALDNVDVDVRAQESLCILGPSGSGKTTLINLLSALDAPTSGTLTINGQRVDGLPERKLVNIRRAVLGYIFQKFHLIPTLTVAENVSLPLLFLGRRPEPGALGKVLGTIGLAERATLPKELRRANAAGCRGQGAYLQPRVLIADEPTGNLDRATGNAIFELFLNAVREHGVALVLTTHNLSLAEQCDRTILLEDGRIVRESP